MQLTAKSRYAVMAMVDIAVQRAQAGGEDRPHSLSDIATRQGISVSILEQIFSKLKGANLVCSIKGPGGGYMLCKSSIDINIGEIILAIEEPIKIRGTAKKKNNNNAKCLTDDLWEGLDLQIDNYLRTITLSDVLRKRVLKKVTISDFELDFKPGCSGLGVVLKND